MAPLDAKPKEKFVGRSVPRLEDRPLLDRARPLCRRHFVSAAAAHARRALAVRARPHPRDRRERGAGAARRARGVDGRRRRRHSADRFPPDPDRRPGALSPATLRDRHGALCRRAGRGRVRRRSLSRRGRRRARRARHRGTAAAPARRRGARRIRTRPLDRAGHRAQGLWRCRRRLPLPRTPWSSRRSRSAGTPACRSRRAAPSRATTRPATCSRFTAPPRCRTGTATRLPRMLGRAPSSVHLYEGHVGGGFGIRGELYPEDVLVCARRAAPAPAGQMDRGPPRASDRRQSFAPAAATTSAPRSIATAAFSRSTTSSSTTRAPICAPMPRPFPISPPRCCRARIAFRPIAPRAYPPHQQDAVRHLSRARPLREHLRARAADRRDRRAARVWIRSRCAGAT